MHEYSSDVGFTPSVKEIQRRKGSRHAYEDMEASGGWRTEVDPAFAQFLAQQTSLFLATVSAEGAPYIQHRGGPPGFVKILGPQTLGFADFKGNRQYISQGNLQDNPKVHIFLIDYMNQRRIKIWGEARIVEDDPELVQQLMPENYKARPEQAVLIDIVAWDGNCPQHIPQRFEAHDVARVLGERDARIAELETRIQELTGSNSA